MTEAPTHLVHTDRYPDGYFVAWDDVDVCAGCGAFAWHPDIRDGLPYCEGLKCKRT
jgi:hypothetical protein